MRTLLEKEGFQIEEAQNGNFAMDFLKVDHNFSLVILDLRMPGMDGWELLHLIRGSVDTAALPVLIRSGVATAQEEAELAILDGYLPQQMTREEIVEAARRVIEEIGAQGPGDKGKVMPKLIAQLKGRADGREINAVATELLSQ